MKSKKKYIERYKRNFYVKSNSLFNCYYYTMSYVIIIIEIWQEFDKNRLVKQRVGAIIFDSVLFNILFKGKKIT